MRAEYTLDWSHSKVCLIRYLILWRSVGYQRPGRTVILPPPKSRDMPDASLITPFLLHFLQPPGALPTRYGTVYYPTHGI